MGTRKNRYPNITVQAKKVRVQIVGDLKVEVMWVKPWTAAVGERVQFRAPGPDWPWHSGIIAERREAIYVIQPA